MRSISLSSRRIGNVNRPAEQQPGSRGVAHRNDPFSLAALRCRGFCKDASNPRGTNRRAAHASQHVEPIDTELFVRQKSLMMYLLQSCQSSGGVWSKAALDQGVNGRGLYVCEEAYGGYLQSSEASTSSEQPSGKVYLSIPVAMTLSPTLPGASAEVKQDLRLQPLLASNEPWEIKLGGMLAVACSGDADGGGARPSSGAWEFWASYRDLMPTSEEQTSLLFFSDQDLEELEDSELAATGHKWRAQVEEAHVKYFQGGQQQGNGATTASVDLEDLRWGVGLSESRAFSVKLDGCEHAAAVPFLDMANHEPHALGYHHYGVSEGRFELRALGPSIPPGSEAVITYGNKANKRLMEQYGFCIPGNPFDRVPFPSPEDLGASRIGRDKVIAALGLDHDHGGRSPALQAVHDAAARAAADIAGLEELPADELWTSMWGPEEQRRIGAVAASLLEKACWRSLSDLRAIRQENANGNKAGSESETLAKLRGWAADRLGQSRTTVAEDAQLLKGDDADTAPSNARLAAAIAYRMEQKKLLMCCDRVFSILQSAGGCITDEE